MEFEVTGKSKGYNLTEMFLKKEGAGKNDGMSFAELAAAKSAEESAKQPDTLEGTKTGLFMGETYEERLNKNWG